MAPSFLFSPTHNPKKNPHWIDAKPGSPLKFYTLIPNFSEFLWKCQDRHKICSSLMQFVGQKIFSWLKKCIIQSFHGKRSFSKYVQRVFLGCVQPVIPHFFSPQLIQSSSMIHSWEKFFKKFLHNEKFLVFYDIFVNNFMLETKKNED